jgi:hypothetical protein
VQRSARALRAGGRLASSARRGYLLRTRLTNFETLLNWSQERTTKNCSAMPPRRAAFVRWVV